MEVLPEGTADDGLGGISVRSGFRCGLLERREVLSAPEGDGSKCDGSNAEGVCMREGEVWEG